MPMLSRPAGQRSRTSNAARAHDVIERWNAGARPSNSTALVSVSAGSADR